MPAGPSELVVIADENSNPVYVVSDLLSQAEHGADSQVILLAISLSPLKLTQLQSEIHHQTISLPRSDIIKQSISHSHVIQVSSLREAVEISNRYAPEHLILHIDNPDEVIPDVVNAGSIFIGKYSPERYSRL